MRHRSILGLGTIVVDHQIFMDRFPQIDTKIEANDSRLQVGGPVPTALVQLSRWGHDCTFCGTWGGDQFGDLIEADLLREGIHFDSADRRSAVTGVAQVWVDQSSGSRTIVCRRGDSEVEIPISQSDRFSPEGVLYLDGWPPETAVTSAKAAREKGMLVFLDTGSPKGQTTELLKNVEIVNLPRRFLNQYFQHDDVEQGARQLLKLGPRLVTITNGAEGAWLMTPQHWEHRPAFPIDAVDTTGAGDIFSAAVLHAVLQDWPVEQLLPFASAAAALKCLRPGNRDALPTAEQVERFLKSQ